MMRIIKDQAGRLEADTVLSLVGLVLSFIPGKFHNRLCIDELVYAIAQIVRQARGFFRHVRRGIKSGVGPLRLQQTEQ